MADRTRITIRGFLEEFKRQHLQMSDRSFCFILGAGASVQSGIPTGAKLVEQWLEELHVREDFQQLPLEEWANSKNLDIDNFDYQDAASYYSQVFKRRFQDDPDTGYAFLEDAMNNKEPSYGYIVLAQILAHTRHKVVITTNFDNLVADALSIYTRTFPLICGHESLTGFVRAQLRRPLVAKIHRDLLLEPINTPEGIATLAPGWVKALTDLLQYYTPIVIGYGGNDGSLMNFLNALEKPIRGGIFWCHRGNVRRNYDEAERLYRKALELNPDDADNTGNFAMFMEDVRQNYDEAVKLYRKALELDPQNKLVHKNYETIKKKQRGRSKSVSAKRKISDYGHNIQRT
jgi:protein O-mannosyl-transferase